MAVADVERGAVERPYTALPVDEKTLQSPPPTNVTSQGLRNALRFVLLANLAILSFCALFSVHMWACTTKHHTFLDSILWKVNKPPLRFLAVGDWGRGGAYNQSWIAAQMGVIGTKIESQFVLSLGDNFYESGLTGREDPFFKQSFTDIYTAKSLQTQWFAILGNHDYYGDVLCQLDVTLTNRDPRWKVIKSGTLSMSLCQENYFGQCKDSDVLEFFMFDTVPMVKSYRSSSKRIDWRGINTSDWDGYNRAQVEELEKALSESTATWKVVVGHHPLYSFGNHGNQPELIAALKPIMEKAGVHVYLNGHDHCMQHIKRDDSSVHYVTSGGGSKAFKVIKPTGTYGLNYWWEGQGFNAIQATKNYLRFDFYGVDGVVLHSFTLTK